VPLLARTVRKKRLSNRKNNRLAGLWGTYLAIVKSFTLFTNSFTKTNSQWLSAEEMTHHVEGCAQNSRKSQKVIYQSFYEYAMTICQRYTNNYEDAVEILNDGFLKIFKEIQHYKPAYTDVVGSFVGWLRKIMTYTAIDHYRRNRKHQIVTYLDNTSSYLPSVNEDAVEKLTHKEIIKAVQNLSPAYQTAFNLFVIGGLTHEEIAKKMGISIGTSKSNLSKAKKQLRKILLKQNNFSAELVTWAEANEYPMGNELIIG
jgi:RNA polymerase sigma factor (sigma-70 family)